MAGLMVRGRMQSAAEERAALLRAVLAEPDNDDPRLVFADWCDENGEDERAAMIRGEWLPHDGFDWRAVLPEVALLSSLMPGHAVVIEGDAYHDPTEPLGLTPGDPTSTEFPGIGIREGFVWHLDLNSRHWFEHGGWVVANHPVRQVWLHDLGPVERSPGEFGWMFASDQSFRVVLPSHVLPIAWRSCFRDVQLTGRSGGPHGMADLWYNDPDGWYDASIRAYLAANDAALDWARDISDLYLNGHWRTTRPPLIEHYGDVPF